ncbi:MAG: hypothetical protein ACSLE5_04660 [Porticoccaceae bacterium]
MTLAPARTVSLIQIFALALVLCVGQFGALLHAEQHPFHQASVSCDAFFAMENGTMVPPPVLVPSLSPAAITGALGAATAATPFSARREPHQSRAPPRYLSV